MATKTRKKSPDTTCLMINGKEYVLVPRRRYDQLTRQEQDRLDARVGEKGRRDYLSGRTKTISHEELKARPGL